MPADQNIYPRVSPLSSSSLEAKGLPEPQKAEINHNESKAIEAFWNFIKVRIQKQNLSLAADAKVVDDEEYISSLIEDAKREPNEDLKDVLHGFELLHTSLEKQKRSFSDLNLNFITSSNDQAFYKAANGKKGVSPGVLICTNSSSLQPIEYGANQQTFQSVIEVALEAHYLLKIKLTGHLVADANGTLQPVLVYHANSGEDKTGVRLQERKVLDDVIESLLAAGYPTVKVLALSHQNAYQLGGDNKVEWNPNLATMLDASKHKITDLSIPNKITYKSRGFFDEQDRYLGPDGPSCPQTDKDGLRVLDANMMIWTSSRKNLNENSKDDKNQLNSDQLKQLKLPSPKDFANYVKGETGCSAHSPVISEGGENGSMTWMLAADTSRTGKKAFKHPKDVYKSTGLTKDGEVKGEVLQAQKAATMQFYILAANEFAKVNPNSLEKSFLKNALLKLLEIMSPDGTAVTKLDKDSFNSFKDECTVLKFTTALKDLIKLQITTSNTLLSGAWTVTLNQWVKDECYKTFTNFLLKDLNAEEKMEDEIDPVSRLKAITEKTTDGGYYDPLKMLWGAFGCELYGGYEWNIKGRKQLSNIDLRMYQLYTKAEMLIKAMVSSAKPFLMAIPEGANGEISEEERQAKLNLPDKALHEMANHIAALLRVFENLLHQQDKTQGSSKVPPLLSSHNIAALPTVPQALIPVQAPRVKRPKKYQVPKTGESPLRIMEEKSKANDVPHKDKKPADWPMAAAHARALFSSFMMANEFAGPRALKDRRVSDEREWLIMDLAEDIIKCHDLKTAYDQRDVSKDVDWGKVKIDLDGLQDKILASFKVLKERTGLETFKTTCLLLLGAVLFLASAALLAYCAVGVAPLIILGFGIYISSSVLTPILAGIGILGLVSSALPVVAVKMGFFSSKPTPVMVKFANEVEGIFKFDLISKPYAWNHAQYKAGEEQRKFDEIEKATMRQEYAKRKKDSQPDENNEQIPKDENNVVP
ncbi:MAG: hypothetical protein H0U75_06975 [Legionella sp.]|nr:hypothetical protein [Legionella sp.]